VVDGLLKHNVSYPFGGWGSTGRNKWANGSLRNTPCDGAGAVPLLAPEPGFWGAGRAGASVGWWGGVGNHIAFAPAGQNSFLIDSRGQIFFFTTRVFENSRVFRPFYHFIFCFWPGLS
jgi:hypothetical protein